MRINEQRGACPSTTQVILYLIFLKSASIFPNFFLLLLCLFQYVFISFNPAKPHPVCGIRFCLFGGLFITSCYSFSALVIIFNNLIASCRLTVPSPLTSPTEASIFTMGFCNKKLPVLCRLLLSQAAIQGEMFQAG